MRSRGYSPHSAAAPLADGALLGGARIAVATSHGRHYYRFVRSLRALGVRFDSITPSRIAECGADIVLSTRAEAPEGIGVPVLHEDAAEEHPLLLCGMMMRSLGSRPEPGDLVLGVDPGSRTGLSVFYCGREIGTSFHTSVDELVSHMIELMAGLGAKRRTVRIGSGNMAVTRRICDLLNLRYCSSFELELVDEHGTSPRTRSLNTRGTRDMLSARSIAQRAGRKRTVLPHSVAA